MESAVFYLIAFPIVFVYLSILWVVVLVVYNLAIEAFDFGPLVSFAGKSAILVSIVSLIYLLPYVHWFTLIVWWIGLMVIFKKDFWECKMLVFLIWGVGFVTRFFIAGMLMG